STLRDTLELGRRADFPSQRYLVSSQTRPHVRHPERSRGISFALRTGCSSAAPSVEIVATNGYCDWPVEDPSASLGMTNAGSEPERRFDNAGDEKPVAQTSAWRRS